MIIAPGITSIAMIASRQFNVSSTPIAMNNRIAASIRVVRRDGYRVGFSRAFLRYLALAVPSIFVFLALFSLWAAIALFDVTSSGIDSFGATIGVFLLIAIAGIGGFLYSLVDQEHRGLHDILAGTVVVAD